MALTNNWALKQGLKFGINIERGTETTLAFDQAAIASAVQCGMTHVRDFLPFNTETNFGLAGWPNLPSAATIDQYLDGGERVLNAGLAWFFDFTDVMNPGDWTGAGLTKITDHVGAVATRLQLRGFPKNRSSFGSTNEWAASTNAITNPARAQLALLIQSILGEDQPITINSANWDYYAQEVSADFVIPARLITPFAQTHCYDYLQQAGWDAVAAKLAALEARLGCPVVMGEVGLYGQNGPYNKDVYEGTIQCLMGAMAQYAPMPWAITNGSADRLNNSATDGTLNPDMVSALTWACSTVKGATVPGGSSPAPAPVVTPPAPPAPPAPTPVAAPAIEISAPGTVTSSGSPTMVQQTVTGPAGTAFAWIVADKSYNWIGSVTSTTIGSNGSVILSVPYNNTGDFLKVMADGSGNAAWNFDGSAIILEAPAPTPVPTPIPTPTPTPNPAPTPTPTPPAPSVPAIEIEVPGSVTTNTDPTVLQQTVSGGTPGTSFVWVVASGTPPDYPWYGDLTDATFDNNGNAVLGVPYHQSGDFLKIMSDGSASPAWNFKGLPVTLVPMEPLPSPAPAPTPGQTPDPAPTSEPVPLPAPNPTSDPAPEIGPSSAPGPASPPAPSAPVAPTSAYTLEQLEVDVLTVINGGTSTSWSVAIAASIAKYQAANPGL